MKFLLSFSLLLGACAALAQSPIPAMPNSVPICTDNQACVITAISDPNAVFQFGAGTTWCQTFNTPKLPLAITSSNTVLCKYNPAPNAVKTFAGQQRNTSYTVTYTLGGVLQPVKTIVGLVAPVSTFPALCTTYSDGTFTCAATGPIKPVGTN